MRCAWCPLVALAALELATGAAAAGPSPSAVVRETSAGQHRSRVRIKTDDGAGKTCTEHPATGVTIGDDIKHEQLPSAEACGQACEANTRCCIAEFDSRLSRCYLKYSGSLAGKGRRKGSTAFTCGGTCGGPPAPAPAPPGPPLPPPSPGPPVPPVRFWDMSKHVGAEYTPWRAGNQFWWHRYAQHRASVQAEIKTMHELLGFTTVRVFLHDLLWDANSTQLLDHMDDFLSILNASDMQAGFVFFDDCWQHSNASVDGHCQPQDGVHNGCWFASPQDDKRAAGVDQFKPYVEGVVKRFASDSRVAWWELFNEPRKHNPFSLALRDKAFGWARGQSPVQPVISCWDDNNDTEAVDTHEYSIPSSRSPVLSNPAKGGIVTEAGARWFQHTHDYGSPLSWMHWLNGMRAANTSQWRPGVMLSWEVMVGNSNTRWYWTSRPGDPEPAVPWCGFLFPDGTPVSYTEAASIRNYTTGKDDFLFFDTGRDAASFPNGAAPEPYIVVNSTARQLWQGPAPASGALYELSIWPDSVTGNMTVTIGDLEVTVDAVPLPFDCRVTQELGCFLDQMRARVLPVPTGTSGYMTHAMCAAFGAAKNLTGPDVVYGVEYGEQCWGELMVNGSQRLNASACEATPCGGDPTEACGGPYKLQAFKASCKPVVKNPVHITVSKSGSAQSATETAQTQPIALADVSSRLVAGSWNILRAVVTQSRIQVFLNTNFKDVVPADEGQPPHPPTPLIDAKLSEDEGGAAASLSGSGGLSVRATGQWRVDYVGVLPPPAPAN